MRIETTRRAGSWLQQLVAGIERKGCRFMAFVRLVPLFPYKLLNYEPVATAQPAPAGPQQPGSRS